MVMSQIFTSRPGSFTSRILRKTTPEPGTGYCWSSSVWEVSSAHRLSTPREFRAAAESYPPIDSAGIPMYICARGIHLVAVRVPAEADAVEEAQVIPAAHQRGLVIPQVDLRRDRRLALAVHGHQGHVVVTIGRELEIAREGRPGCSPGNGEGGRSGRRRGSPRGCRRGRSR